MFLWEPGCSLLGTHYCLHRHLSQPFKTSYCLRDLFIFINFFKIHIFFFFTFQIKYQPSHTIKPEDKKTETVSREIFQYTIKGLIPNTEYVLEIDGRNSTHDLLYSVNEVEVVFTTKEGEVVNGSFPISLSIVRLGNKVLGCPSCHQHVISKTDNRPRGH